MKTAMQELIDLMKSHEARGWGNMTFDFFFAQLDEMKALEKEKEQIIDAYCRLVIDDLGYILNDKYEYAENKRIAEDYYNQTYNQNK